jgi:phage tail-like protein
MAELNRTALRHDPVLNHNFVISLLDTSSALGLLGSLTLSAIFDVALGGFSECSGLEMSLQVEEYKEGGNNGQLLKFPSRVTWSNITLKKGIGASTALWDWHYRFVEGRGKRRDGVIVLLTDLHTPNNIWYFRRGLPVKYTGPSMNATQNSVAIEAIEIAHEGIYQVPAAGPGAAAVGAVAGLGL